MKFQYSDRIKDLKGNTIREIFKVLEDPEVISFAGGFPATDCLPTAKIREIAGKVLSGNGAVGILQYGGTEGYLPFRKTGIEYVKKVGITDIGLDNLIVVSGGQQTIDLSCKALVNKGDVVLVQNPTYLAALHILKTYEARAVGVAEGEDGLDLVDLEKKIKQYHPKFLYLVPNFSNPTGKTLGLAKRREIAALTAKYDLPVLEDDPYRELRYSGEPLPAIKSFDKAGNVIYTVSFSKTVAPGLRTAFAVGDPEIIRKLTIGKQAVDVHTSSLSQAIVNEFLQGDTLSRQLETSIPVYRRKRDAMLAAIEKYMPEEFHYTHPDGGLFIWGEFPKDSKIDTQMCFQKAIENKVVYVSGVDFYADPGEGVKSLRLNFSNSSDEKIDIGMKRLGDLFKSEVR